MTEPNKPLTVGQKLVGINFNPAGSKDVNDIKAAAAVLIDLIGPIGDVTPGSEVRDHFVSQAADHVLIAQMLAVKAATWELN